MSSYLITGGTGSLAGQLIRDLIASPRTSRVVCFSRCEAKQERMRQAHPAYRDPRMRYYLGDIRDVDRCEEAMRGVDHVVHAAALKQVPAGQTNPDEFARTNVDGTINVIRAAHRAKVKKVLCLSSDKAVEPRNIYGSCKKLLEDFAVTASQRFAPVQVACTRYGNVWMSHGSVMEKWASAGQGETVEVRDFAMTRFLITLPQAARFVLGCLSAMKGGEIFVPDMPAATLLEIFRVFFTMDQPHTIVGPLAGEKFHETLIAEHELHRTIKSTNRYVITPPMEINLPTYCQDPRFGLTDLTEPLTSDKVRMLSAANIKEMIYGIAS